MRRQKLPVITGRIDTMTYDRAGRTLEVQFKNGAIRRYYKVPTRAYTALWKAYGAGNRLDGFSRQGMYPTVMVREPDNRGAATEQDTERN